jgi:hypothetical protein
MDEPKHRQLTEEKIAKLTKHYESIANAEYTGGGRKPGRRYYEWCAKVDHAKVCLRQLGRGLHPGNSEGWKLYMRGRW